MESIEVFAGNIVEVGLVQSLLDKDGIQSWLKDEVMGTLNPWYTSPGGTGARHGCAGHRRHHTGAAGAARVTAVHVEESTGPKLDEANVVVSGGRGLGEAGSYSLV